MPMYEYRCSKCENRFELIQKFSAPPEAECPECGAVAGRLLSAPAIQFKGSGWYVTDYAQKGSRGDDSGDGSGDSSSGSESSGKEKKEGAAKESKPAKAKPEKKAAPAKS